MNIKEDIERTLAEFRRASRRSTSDSRFEGLGKADTFDQSSSPTTGLTYYDLETGAKFLYPVLTPIRNSLPRVSGKGGTQANWAGVTAINSTGVRAGVGQGNRGGVTAVTTQNFSAAYAGLGLESNVSFEAQYAGQGFDDIRAVATKTLLESLMIQEEYTILGGNFNFHLNGGSATPTPTLADSTAISGGGLSASTTYYVICVALSFDAYTNGTVSSTGVQGSITRTNADGSTDTFGGGAGMVSAETSITTSSSGGATHTVTASLSAPIAGAAGYAWYLGSSSGQEKIAAITTQPTVNLQALPSSSNQLASSLGASDNSVNALVFNGLLYLAFTTGSNAYVQAVSNSNSVANSLTPDNAGGIVEIDTALKNRWDNYRLGFNKMWVNSQEALNISHKILSTTSSNPGAQRFMFAADQNAIQGGVIITRYLNKFTNSVMDMVIHPNMPPGMILFTQDTMPYPLSNVPRVMQIRARQDYYQIEWPRRSRKYEYGVYTDEVLQHYFTPALGVLYNIANG